MEIEAQAQMSRGSGLTVINQAGYTDNPPFKLLVWGLLMLVPITYLANYTIQCVYVYVCVCVCVCV